MSLCPGHVSPDVYNSKKDTRACSSSGDQLGIWSTRGPVEGGGSAWTKSLFPFTGLVGALEPLLERLDLGVEPTSTPVPSDNSDKPPDRSTEIGLPGDRGVEGQYSSI